MKVIGGKGKKKMKDESVIVVGEGGMGEKVMKYMEEEGVGKIGIVDEDKV